MKLGKLTATLAFALGAATTAYAAAPYDGIWQVPATQIFFTITEKNGYAIVSNYFTNGIATPERSFGT